MGERYKPGALVWISPKGATAQYMREDEGRVLEDFDTCYLVLQESELVCSDGRGHIVNDVELEPLIA